MSGFADRLIGAIREKGTPLCVGIDPRWALLPEEIKRRASGEASAVAAFGREVVDIVSGLVPAVKVQVAFYERLGAEGMKVFAETLGYARERGLVVIADVKRGDIGATAEAYAEAYLGKGAEFEADAITVSPYLGEEGLSPFVKAAEKEGRGVFVVVRSSNPSSDYLQSFGGEQLYVRVGKLVRELGKGSVGESGYSSIGAVVGGTQRKELEVLRRELPRTIFLVPGYGAQGAAAKDVAAAFNRDGLGAIVASSRGIIYAYADPREASWRDSIRSAAEKAIEELSEWHRGLRGSE